MGIIVIVGYKPFPGKEIQLAKLMATHHAILFTEGLVTERKSIVGKSQDGTIIEVFEWASEELMKKAHTNANVLAMWKEYEAICSYVPIAEVPESSELFSGFTPLN